MKPVLRLEEPRVLSSFISDAALPRITDSAGTVPNTRPVKTARPTVNASTAGFSGASVSPAI